MLKLVPDLKADLRSGDPFLITSAIFQVWEEIYPDSSKIFGKLKETVGGQDGYSSEGDSVDGDISEGDDMAGDISEGEDMDSDISEGDDMDSDTNSGKGVCYLE